MFPSGGMQRQRQKLDLGPLCFSDCHQPNQRNLEVTKLSQNSAGKQRAQFFSSSGQVFIEKFGLHVIWQKVYTAAQDCIPAPNYSNKLPLCEHIELPGFNMFPFLVLYFIFFILRCQRSFLQMLLSKNIVSDIYCEEIS